MRIFMISALLTIVCSGPVDAQEKSWVGKTILVKESGIQITKIDDGQEVTAGTLSVVDLRVLDERNGRIKVNDGHGHEGWFEKTAAVPLEDAVAFFTERIQRNPREAESYNRRGAALTLKGEHASAIRDFDEAVRLSRSAYAYCSPRGPVGARGEGMRPVSLG